MCEYGVTAMMYNSFSFVCFVAMICIRIFKYIILKESKLSHTVGIPLDVLIQ